MFDTNASTAPNWALFLMPSSADFQQFPGYLFSGHSVLAAWTTTSQYLTISMAWKLLVLIFVLANMRHVPFVYHLRILNAIRFVCRSQRPKVDIKPEQIFQPLITSSRPCLMDIDVLGHKSNSTYFVDLDVARVHLVTTVFGKGILKHRGSTTMNGLSGKPSSKLSLALGAVSCVFRKELAPYEKYEVWTRVLSWDRKWLYIVSHFVKKGSKIEPEEYTLYPKQQDQSRRGSADTRRGPADSRRGSEDPRRGSVESIRPSQSSKEGPTTPNVPIAASALSKVVWKDGRKTIPPAELMAKADLLPERTPENAALLDAIERERVRGLAMADNLARLSELDQEFEDTAALGRHHDGIGLEGVVATLAQLGGISKYQLL